MRQGLTVPILTWLNPSGVDAEAAAIGRIDIAVGSVDELEALLKQTRLLPYGSTCTWTSAWPEKAARVHEWDALIARARQGQRRGRSVLWASWDICRWPTTPFPRGTRRRCRTMARGPP